jgi:hypothetical protein
MLEYERAIHVEPFLVKGESCKAKSSTGLSVMVGFIDSIF